MVFTPPSVGSDQYKPGSAHTIMDGHFEPISRNDGLILDVLPVEIANVRYRASYITRSPVHKTRAIHGQALILTDDFYNQESILERK